MLSKDERDEKGNLTDMALALDALENHGCDCGTDEQGTCLACRCERALRTERARAEKAEEEAQDWRDSHDIVMQEKCAKDELHCTCVPILRREVERLKDWKESALAVERLWDEQAVAKELEVGLGLTVRDKILPGIQALRVRAEKAEESASNWKECLDMVRQDLQKLGVDLSNTPPYSTNDAMMSHFSKMQKEIADLEQENRRLDGELFKWKP